MKAITMAAAFALLVAMAAPGAQAAGCIKGAVVGGVAGHLVGHGVAGAAVGCAVGHHEAAKAARERQAAQTRPQDANRTTQ